MDTEKLIQSAEDKMITGDFNKALGLLNQVLEEEENERAMYLRGYLHYCLHEYEKAVPELLKVTINYPENEEAHYYLSQIYAGNGDYEAAKVSIEKALQCDPENTDYLGDYISIEQALKNFEHCIELCGVLLDEMEDSHFALNTRGFCYMKMGKPEAAMKDFKKCAKENPRDFMSWSFMAALHIDNEEYDLAEKAIKQSIRNNPQFSDPYANWGYMFLKMNMIKDALLALNKALELDSLNADAYKKRAEVFLAEGEQDKARADLLKAQELNYSFYYDNQVEELLASLNNQG
ncbi:MAG: tetratricopeptide repeat protein [Bacteroidales bacterium]|nr:tetratricopeptide repeat protein [Bacteroidales bacterium]